MPGSSPGMTNERVAVSIRHFPGNPVCIPRRMIATGVLIPRPLGNTVTKPELGTKRLCAGCNAKFYDLLKSPIVCPTCEAVFVLPKVAPSRPRRGFEPLPAIAAIVAAPELAPKAEDATASGETADGEKEADGGVALLEEMDED
jgi:uncharacterized protein (TIGR02300 family)